eukprot:2256563-Pleurochrysis_carterae.AAC.1
MDNIRSNKDSRSCKRSINSSPRSYCLVVNTASLIRHDATRSSHHYPSDEYWPTYFFSFSTLSEAAYM